MSWSSSSYEVHQSKVDVSTRASVKRANMVVAGAISVEVDIRILGSNEVDVVVEVQ